MILLSASRLGVIREGRELLSRVDLQLAAGELHVLLGPTGAGKSTLLRALAGEWPATSGTITLGNTPLTALDALAQARRRAVLPQQDALSFGLTVRQLASLGRYSAVDQRASTQQQIIDAVLQATDLTHLAARPYPELSGGERRRAQLARVLAQVWDVPQALLLLDEPIHSLDLAHQHAVLGLLRQLAARGFAVLASLHELNHAASAAHRISLIQSGCIVACGAPERVLDGARLQALYGDTLQFAQVEHAGTQHWLTTARPLAANAPQPVARPPTD